MKIAIISATTFPASLPDDFQAKHGYGSETMNAVLAQGMIEAGHEVDFFAPLGSSILGNFHPLYNSRGQHLPSELFEFNLGQGIHVSLENPPLSHQMLKDFDFVIDGSKSGENVEQLKLFDGFNKFACYRSGYQDWNHPFKLDPADRHLVTHCNYFKDNFDKNGFPVDVAHFGVHPFWEQGENNGKYLDWVLKQDIHNYFLFPHRTSPQKGIDTLLKLAKTFPDETFVIATATPLPDHQQSLKDFKQRVETSGLSNIKFVVVPEGREYDFYRRELLRNAKAILSPFSNEQGYMDTGGLISLEALACGTPVLVSRSPGSEELLQHQEDGGVIFCDGYDAFRLAIKHEDFAEMKPKTLVWTVENYINEWMKIIEKFG